MRVSIVLLVLALCFMPVWAEEGGGAAVEPGDAFSDWYWMLEMQAGSTFDFRSDLKRPYVAGKVGAYRDFVGVVGTEFDIDEETEAKGMVAALAGVTYNIGNLRQYGVDISWAEHFGFNVGVCGTYEFEEGDFGFKAMLSVVDLSFDEGNASRHKAR